MASIDAFFKGKSVLITGGSSGIGYASAARMLKAGATVTLVARRAAALEEAKARLGGTRVHTLALDVSHEAEVAARVAEHLTLVPTDILINNAGVVMPGRFTDLDPAQFHSMMDINYFGTTYMCRAVIPHLIERRGGAILNVSSMAGLIGVYGYTAYAASKFAVYGFSEALRGELVPHGIQVSVCMPPDTDTPQLAFENLHKPKETKAITGSVKTMTADAVAEQMLGGFAGGSFAIVPGFDGRSSWWIQRWAPGIVRWYSDMAMKKA